MKDLCENIRNPCRIIGGLLHRLKKENRVTDEEYILIKSQLKRQEDALLKYQVRNEAKTNPKIGGNNVD